MKSILTLSDDHNPNYVAQIVKIGKIFPHSNADKLVCTYIHGNKIIYNNSLREENLMIYFSAESKLSEKFCHLNNLFDKNDMNQDSSIKGYINSQCRIRTIKLRGEISQGLLMPLESLEKLFNIDISELKIGQVFDMINNELLVSKYISERTEKKHLNLNKKLNKSKQIKINYPTIHFMQNIDLFNDDEQIYLSKKYHGTSGIAAKLPIFDKLSFIKRAISKIFNIKILPKYELIAHSRKRPRDPYGNTVWGIASRYFNDFLVDGMTIYYEAVGYGPNNKLIQNGYDYNCKVGETKFIIYRITITDINGNVIEWTPEQIMTWANERNLLCVKFIRTTINKEKLFDHNLSAKDPLFYGIEPNDEIQKYIFNYIDEIDPECITSKVPFEGLCIKKVSTIPYSKNVQKIKCESFVLYETSELDRNNLDESLDE